MPLRSAGCATCRKRKIRCDEARPFCNRCTVHGVPCPGYRTAQPGGVEFRDVTAQVARRASAINRSTKASSTAARSQASSARRHDETTSTLFPSSSSSASSSSAESVDDVGSAAELVSTYSSNHSSVSSLYSDTMAPFGYAGPSSTVLAMPSPSAANTAQVYSSFLHLWLPTEKRRTDHAALWGQLPAYASRNATLNSSLHALSCIAVGSEHRDDRLVRVGLISYGSALNGLVKSLASKKSSADDELLAAVSVLAVCEFHEVLERKAGGWLKHIDGARKLIESRGPDSITSMLGLTVFSNARHASLSQGIIARKRCWMAEPAWRALAFRCPIVDAATHFYDLSLRVPGLLEQHDLLLAQPDRAREDVRQLWQQCAQLESSLRDWYRHWRPSGDDDDDTVIVDVRPVETFTTFAGLVSDRTIAFGFTFVCYAVGYLASCYWSTLHSLRSAMQSLYGICRALDLTDVCENETTAPTESELTQYAVNLAQCVPFFCEPSTSAMGHIGIFLPVYVMAMQFRKTGDFEKLLWVRKVQGSVFNRGIVPPQVRDERGELIHRVLA